jgi:hypothetical protein
METISEVVYWAVLLYTPIYWFIGLIVLGGCFIAGTIWRYTGLVILTSNADAGDSRLQLGWNLSKKNC